MTKQTRAEQELSIKVFLFAMWSAVVIFVVMGVSYYFDIISVNQGKSLGIALLGLALFDVFLIKFMVKKMRAKLDKT